VHEAYLRIAGDRPEGWSSPGQFFAAAAEAMRRILIEHARARGRVKRGGDGAGRPARRVPLNVIDLAAQPEPEEILMLDAAFSRLEKADPQSAKVARLRVYAGLSVDDTAAALGISPSTVDREWAYARAHLQLAMTEGQSGTG
jgi:RNA polymerase sigma factor (TIGR02999 family)